MKSTFTSAIARACLVCCTLAPLLTLGIATSASGQAYPTKPIRMLVGSAPGGPIDLVARLTAQKLTDALGQAVVVETRSGAGGTIATEYVAKVTPRRHVADGQRRDALHYPSSLLENRLRHAAGFRALVKDLADTATRQRLIAQGLDPIGNSPEAFSKLLREGGMTRGESETLSLPRDRNPWLTSCLLVVRHGSAPFPAKSWMFSATPCIRQCGVVTPKPRRRQAHDSDQINRKECS